MINDIRLVGFGNMKSLLSIFLILLLVSSFSMPYGNIAHASSNANLFVSVENSQYNNYFAGPQVVQVVVSDPDINRLDTAYAEPFVSVNGKKLRMAQATDGNWYGYFADSKQAQIADSTQPANSGFGLDFGYFCRVDSGPIAGVDFSDAKGVVVARSTASGGFAKGSSHPNATMGGAACGAVDGKVAPSNPIGVTRNNLQNHVIKENKTLTTPNGSVTKFGQISSDPNFENAWPIIQLFDFGSLPNTVFVGGVQGSTTLTFDRIPVNLITSSLDRTEYPKNAMVFIGITDPQLNIDPTEEDSWTWGANQSNSTLYYEAFTRNGAVDADGSSIGMQSITGNLTALMFNHNGKLTVNTLSGIDLNTRVIDFQGNGKQLLNGTTNSRGDPAHQRTKSIGLNSEPITFIESGGVNTGFFANWDGAKKSDIITVNNNSIRGQQASFKYNDVSTSIATGFTFGSIYMTAINNTWIGGYRIPVTLEDPDVNLNSKISERLNVYDPNVKRITTQKIGTPFSLNAANFAQYPAGPETASFVNGTTFTELSSGNYSVHFNSVPNTLVTRTTNVAQDEGFSNRPIFAPNNEVFLTGTSPGSLVVDLHTTMQTLRNTIHNTLPGNPENFKGFNLFTFDARSLSTLTNATGNSVISNVSVYLLYNKPGSTILNGTGGPLPTLNAISIINSTGLQAFANLNTTSSLVQNPVTLNNNLFKIPKNSPIGLMFTFTVEGGPGNTLILASGNGFPVMGDFGSFGIIGDATSNAQRINNEVYRFELEETGSNTGIFTGTNQFVMANQINIFDPAFLSQLQPISHNVKFAAIQDMLQAEARAPQVTYLDLGRDGVDTQQSAQVDIPTHSGVVSFDSKTYKISDTVTVTLDDQDLNVNGDLIDIYTVVPPIGNTNNPQDVTTDTIGTNRIHNLNYTDGTAFGKLLDIQFGQQNIRWSNSYIDGQTGNNGACFGGGVDSNSGTAAGFATSLYATGFSLVETGPTTGIFTGTFEIPDQVCQNHSIKSAVNQNMKVNYVDFRDDMGKLAEVSDNSDIRANTGSVSLDRDVYPVPFGTVGATATTANDNPPGTGGVIPSMSVTSQNGIFPLHRDLVSRSPSTGGGLISANVLPTGTVLAHIRVSDRDFDTSPAFTDHIAVSGFDASHGPVAIQITRQGNSMLLATAGGPIIKGGKIVNLNGTQLPAPGDPSYSQVPDLGPMTEIAPDAGTFQADLPIELTDGPAGTGCPPIDNWDGSINGTGFSHSQSVRFYTPAQSGQSGNYCVRQGDVLTVSYKDQYDVTGNPRTVNDTATFDLSSGKLQSDKSVYDIGSDMILTLVDPDLNLDSQIAESIPLDLLSWNSHAFNGTMGPLGGQVLGFDPQPNTFVETGKNTGIFQSVIKIPKQLNSNLLLDGEQVKLEYTDWGPNGSKTVGLNHQDIDLVVKTTGGIPLYCGKPASTYAHIINGTSGNDNLVGTNDNDLILGNGGNDTITGNGGDDCLLGGAGNDTINGGPGNDFIDGGSGDDALVGGSGNDTIQGSSGNDIIDGGTGDDKLYGGAGNDTINGSDGNDYMNGGDGDDKLYGGAGNDEIHGMNGNDYINAGDDNDTIFGGAGNDEIHGGAGDDLINGGDGTDKCFDTLGNNTKVNCES